MHARYAHTSGLILAILIAMLSISNSVTKSSDGNDLTSSMDDAQSGSANIAGFQTGSIFTADTFASGADHNCAVLDNQTLECWGKNTFSQLGGTSAGIVDFSTIAVAGTPAPGDALFPTSVAAGQYHTCAIMSDAKLVCWGANSYGQLGIGTNSTTPEAPS